MIVDIILDRRDGEPYSQQAFLDYAIDGEYESVAKALMTNDESVIKQTLKDYLDNNQFNPEIGEYIDSVNWVVGDGVKPVEMKERWTVYWNNFQGTGHVVHHWVRASISDEDLEEQWGCCICTTKHDAEMLLNYHFCD